MAIFTDSINKVPQIIDYSNVFLWRLKNNLIHAKLISRMNKSDLNKLNFNTVSVRRPVRFKTVDGVELNTQNILMGSEIFTIDKFKHVGVAYEELESINTKGDLLDSQVITAAAAALAQEIDMCIAQECIMFPTWIGDPGKTIEDYKPVIDADSRLTEEAVPPMGRNAIFTPTDAGELRKGLIGSNIQVTNKTALIDSSFIDTIAGCKLYQTQNVASFTTGTRAKNGGQISTANQEVNYQDIMNNPYASQSLKVKLGANQTVKRGDTFTITGVNAVQPVTGQEMDYLRQFVIIEDASASGTGDATIKISPAIIIATKTDSTGKTLSNETYATCSASPARGAAITFVGGPNTTFRLRSLFHNTALKIAFAPPTRPESGTYSTSTDPLTGISVRYWRASDIKSSNHYHRWDIYFGVKNMQNMFGAKLNGNK